MTAELIEDEDGAPLPVELQRGTRIYNAVLAWLTDPNLPVGREEVEQWPKRTTDDLMIRLAPILWPVLPSNDDSGVALARRTLQRLVDDLEREA